MQAPITYLSSYIIDYLHLLVKAQSMFGLQRVHIKAVQHLTRQKHPHKHFQTQQIALKLQ